MLYFSFENYSVRLLSKINHLQIINFKDDICHYWVLEVSDLIGLVQIWYFRGDFRKKNRWFEDICQISTDPPSPYLILDIFILDKYRLVFTPPPPT